jgi:hypothetical protein
MRMSTKRLSTALSGLAIIASSSLLVAGASAASASTAPAAATTAVTISAGNCTLNVAVGEYRDANGAYVDAYVSDDSCGIGVEGAIEGPDGTPYSYGGDVKQAGDDSVTGHIPVNSGNHHGFRYWLNNVWNYYWAD